MIRGIIHKTQSLLNSSEAQIRLREEFEIYEKGNRIDSLKLGAFLVMFFMPAGSLLEVFVYPDSLLLFLGIRLLSSISMMFIWWALNHPIASNYYRPLGWAIAIIPTTAITFMIASEDGFNSPYYAGLNLVFLGSVIVLRWTFLDSLLVFIVVMTFYLLGCAWSGFAEIPTSIIFNNLYFLAVTGIFILLGSFAYDRIRFNEFKLNRELTQQREKLIELDQSKNQFFANLSHELRTPLTLILGQVEGLKKAPSNIQSSILPNGYEVQSALEGMENSGLRLFKLINELLDLMKLDQKTLQVSWDRVHVQSFLKGIVSAVRGAADLERVRIQFECQNELGERMVDRDKLETILINLITNAIKFSGPGRTVNLRARIESMPDSEKESFGQGNKDRNQLVIEVQDNGPGIAKENLRNIFDRFWQADGSIKKLRQGTGIGLAIVKEFVGVMGGEIRVESELNHGVFFQLRFPEPNQQKKQLPTQEIEIASDSTEEKNGARTQEELELNQTEDTFLSHLREKARKFSSSPGLQSRIAAVEPLNQRKLPTVLVADDEPEMRRLISSQLEPEFNIIQAADGEQALQLARQYHPDLVILDWMMPELDGLQTLKAIRESTLTRSIPALMLTAWANNESRNQALELGANEFLTKPFSSVELLLRVKNLIKLYQWQGQVEKQNKELKAALDELDEAQKELFRTQKFASLGKMSATMIHEINNPLNYMTTALHGLKKDIKALTQDRYVDEGLCDIGDGIDRINRIVSGLKSFAYHSKVNKKLISVSDVIQESVKWMGPNFSQEIQLDIEINPDTYFSGDKELCMQVFTNLLKNSKDALSEKTFSKDQRPTIEIKSVSAESRIMISIRDNGPGILDEHMIKIFDPFYTSKDVGKGLGLGLSVVHNIIEAHGGNVHIESDPGEFCEFQIYFPAPQEVSYSEVESLSATNFVNN